MTPTQYVAIGPSSRHQLTVMGVGKFSALLIRGGYRVFQKGGVETRDTKCGGGGGGGGGGGVLSALDPTRKVGGGGGGGAARFRPDTKSGEGGGAV